MDRITHPLGGCGYKQKGCLYECELCPHIHEILNRLCQYEGMGFMPEEVARLAILEEYGRIVELPCSVGDSIYYVHESYLEGETEKYIIEDGDCEWINIEKTSVYIKVRYDCGLTIQHPIRDFGKTVFLTREEAEAALKGISGV
jgi:hypothetical protein